MNQSKSQASGSFLQSIYSYRGERWSGFIFLLKALLTYKAVWISLIVAAIVIYVDQKYVAGIKLPAYKFVFITPRIFLCASGFVYELNDTWTSRW